MALAEPEERFIAYLREKSVLSAASTESLRLVASEASEPLGQIALKLGLLAESRLAEEMASFSGLMRATSVKSDAVFIASLGISTAFLRSHEIIPLSAQDNCLVVACWDVLDEYCARALEFATAMPVVKLVATRSQVVDQLRALLEASGDGTAGPEGAGDQVEEDEIDRLRDLASDAPTIRLAQRLLSEAVLSGASDIHIEPSINTVHVRYRLDGMLREVEQLGFAAGTSVVSRLKVMASLNIAERRLPQDGRIRIAVHGKDIDLRVATSPTLHGESVVLRILDRQQVMLDFEALGFDSSLMLALRQASAKPHGIMLVTGPTGSGKTTTLYAALKEINTPDRKILTVEDPVEYALQGVNQVTVKPQIGLTFAQALRAFLRHDPDVIMVGEIRDKETAQIAVQAALTGHLLLSTLHTNTAAAAVTRLLDMGIDDYLLTSTLNLIVGQRLVRKLCPACRIPSAPTHEMIDRFHLSEPFDSWYRPSGCPECQGTGYRGRTTVAEVLLMTEAVRAAILSRADAHAIEKVAVNDGMRTLIQHGLSLVLAGVTSIDEVLRVTSDA